MVLMSVLGLLLVVGVGLTLRWGGTAYQTSDAAHPADRDAPTLGVTSRTYLRGVAIALVGGFWAGMLVTGPAMRLIMRLLAATGGDRAQGRLTEADEVVGNIDFDGTLGLLVFGGLLPGLVSGGIYLLVRRWLPPGRLGGIAFGGLHLVIAATRIDPLRPDNRDFDIVGPGWLAVVTFGLAVIVHGMAVVAIANRFSTGFPPTAADRAARVRAYLPLALPVLILIPGFPLLVPILLGLGIALVGSRVDVVRRAALSRRILVGGRVAIAVAAAALLPGTVIDLRDVVSR